MRWLVSLFGHENMFVAGRNSGEVRHSRPSEPVSPRRDLQEQARAAIELSLRRKLLFWASHHLVELQRCMKSSMCSGNGWRNGGKLEGTYKQWKVKEVIGFP